VGDIEGAVVPARVAARVEVTAVVRHVGDDKYAWLGELRLGLAVDHDLSVCESRGKDLFDDGLDVRPVATKFAGFLKPVDDGCVHAQRGHDQERVVVAERDIDPPGLRIDLELLQDPRWFAGHLEGVADEVGGPSAAVLEGDLGLREQGEQVVHGAIAPNDDEAIGIAKVLRNRDSPPADVVHGDCMATTRCEFMNRIGKALGFTAA